ncbi:hypothetical protein HDU84_002653 [Entophlyctis sp. JEL0112]|nr:hypothetical protein HDU84_002653 [Entophlyctis sp. JEL0112]
MVHCASGEHPISKVAGLLRLEKNPDDFAAWESLIKLAEAESAVSPSNLRLVYDGFLAKFPLCFGYWKKYADSALRLEGTEKADEVFERGVTAIQNSIDLWNHYIQFKLDKSDDVDAIRALFERAAQGVGHDFLAHTFWDKYIDFEENRQKSGAHLLAILERIIRIPLHQYARYFEKYSQVSVTRPVNELLEQAEIDRLSSEIASADPMKGDIEQELRQKIHALKSDIYLKTQEIVHKCWAFESEIKRPYFHIKPIDEAQLANWRKYLDFQESVVDSGLADVSSLYVLFERCLVPCALYEEFWLRYARFLIAKGDVDGAKHAYHRASQVFLAAGRTELRLEYAAFEEEHAPGHLETIFKHAHYLRRNFGVEKGEEALSSAIEAVSDEKARGFLVATKARYIHSHKGSVVEARNTFISGLSASAESKYLVLQYFLFELSLPVAVDKDAASYARAAWEVVKSSPTFTEYDKLTLGQKFADYLVEKDENLVSYNNLLAHLNSSYKMPTTEQALIEADGSGNVVSKKRGAPADDAANKIPRVANAATPVMPVAALPAQKPVAYGAYGGGQAAPWGGYGRGW